MLPQTPRNTRLAVVSLVVLAAILMIVWVPFIGFDMVNRHIPATTHQEVHR